jgi:hypothetical protein
MPAAAWPVSHVPFPRQNLTLDEETKHAPRFLMVCGSIPNAESNWPVVTVSRQNIALDE